jgi:ribosomal-protein-alanine N-acetyltransferase
MKYQFVPMTEEYADQITGTWQYESPYQVYDYSREDPLHDPENWEKGQFAAIDEDGVLIGEYLITFSKGIMWIEFGLKPEYTGRGLGEQFVKSGIDFGIKHYNYDGQKVMMNVLAFDQRGIKVFERIGFKAVGYFHKMINGKEYEMIKMCYEIED